MLTVFPESPLDGLKLLIFTPGVPSFLMHAARKKIMQEIFAVHFIRREKNGGVIQENTKNQDTEQIVCLSGELFKVNLIASSFC